MDNSKILSPEEELQFQQLAQLRFWENREEKVRADMPGGQVSKAAIPSRWELTRGIALHQWQEQCVEAWTAAGGKGVIKVVTGAGKTVLAMAIAERLQQTRLPQLRIAIVVPTVVLLEQWKAEFIERSNLPADAIGLVGGGHDETFSETIRVLISVLNSASKKLPTVVREANVGDSLLLIVDECHRAGAAEMQKVFQTERAFSLGLSATPERDTDAHDDEEPNQSPDEFPAVPLSFEDTVLGQELGPVIFELNYAEAISLGVLPPFSICHYGLSLTPQESSKYERTSREITDLRKELERPGRQGLGLIRWCRSKGAANFPAAGRLLGLTVERKRLLFRMEERSKAVLRILETTFAENPAATAILFHESIEEVVRLFQLLRSRGLPVVAEHSEFPDQMRAASLRLFRNGVARVIVSARSLIEGFNVPAADIGIIIAASSSVRQRVQTLGRLLRKSRSKDGAEKHATLHVLYAANTVDEFIYEKADWEQFIGAERNRYFLWPNVETSNPTPAEKAPRAPQPNEQSVDGSALVPSGVYPGNVDEGVAYTRDTQGTIRSELGELIHPHAELAQILKNSRKTAGRFRITPVRHFVVELEKTSDGWRGLYLGKLSSAIQAAVDDFKPSDVENLHPGDSYPLAAVNGETFSVLQRDQRLIAKKENGRTRFVAHLHEVSDLKKRESLAAVQSILRNLPGRGHRISKITVTQQGHVVYVFNNQAFFIGHAPNGETGFTLEQ